MILPRSLAVFGLLAALITSVSSARPARAGEPATVRYARHVAGHGRTDSAEFGNLGSLGGESAGTAERGAWNQRVREFLGTHEGIAGDIDPVSNLALVRITQSRLGSHTRFRQVLGDRPVFDTSVVVHAAGDGTVYGVSSSVVRHLAPELATIDPAIDGATAEAVALDHFGLVPADLRTEDSVPAVLGITATDDGGRLSWRIIVNVREPYAAWDVRVDAGTGEIVGTPASLVLNSGTAKVFVPNPIVSTGDTSLRDDNNAAGAVPQSAYSTVTLAGLNNSGFVSGTYCTTDRTPNRVSASNGDFTSLRRNDTGFNEVESYWAIDTAQRYLQNSVGVASAANYQIRVNAYAFAADNSNYQTFGGGQGVLNFGYGGVDDAQDAEIVWHEYGHAILDNQAEINFSGEAQAIHEGWGDYFAATMSTTVPGESRFYPTIGEWDATSYDIHNPPYLRRVDGTKKYPQDLRNEPHDDGEIYSACLWAIHEDLGRAAADEIILNGNFLLPRSATFSDAAAAMVEADFQLNGGANTAAITSAFASHGITVAKRDPLISAVRLKKKKLVVDGTFFATSSAVIEIDGTALGSMKYPKKYGANGVSSRITSADSAVLGLAPGVPVQVTVLNPATGARSAPYTFTP